MNAWKDLVLAQSIPIPLTYDSGQFDDRIRDLYTAHSASYIDEALRALYGNRLTGRAQLCQLMITLGG